LQLVELGICEFAGLTYLFYIFKILVIIKIKNKKDIDFFFWPGNLGAKNSTLIMIKIKNEEDINLFFLS
jgi:hypothetical protein